MSKVNMQTQIIEEVKMPWALNEIITTRQGTVFVVAGHEYDSTEDGVTVFFNSHGAFLFGGEDEQGEYLYDLPQLKEFLKEKTSAGFPDCYDEYLEIVNVTVGGFEIADQKLIDKYNLGDYLEDIKNRINDLQFTGIDYNPEEVTR